MTAASDGRRERHDPWWDLEGAGVRRSRTIHRAVSSIAFLTALAACGAVAVAWAVKLGLLATLTVA